MFLESAFKNRLLELLGMINCSNRVYPMEKSGIPNKTIG